MVNNSKLDLNLKIGKILTEARANSGLTPWDVEKTIKTMSVQTLDDIERGLISIPCCDLYELLKLYPDSVEDHLLFFCTISLEREGVKL